MGIAVETYLRSEAGTFTRVAEVARHTGDDRHVPGAIELVVDGQPVLDRELWDDVDWLWPFVVQALDDCLTSGVGERWFPDQPILFRVEAAGESRLLFTVDGGPIHRVVSADRQEAVRAVAAAALDFFAQLGRLVPGPRPSVAAEIDRVRAWPGVPEA